MDISAILPVNMGQEASSSLNDDFSAQTPAGENIFDKPLGARTFFRTESNGLVCASFMFDPKKTFGEDHIMASVTSDWMHDLREALTTLLLDPKDVAPKTKTLEETIWDQMTSLLPKETIAKNLFADKAQFELYTSMLKTSVTKNFVEEQALTAALTTKAFSFSFEVAIDAYPQELGGNNEKKIGEKMGVLTFHIEGIPDGVIPLPVPTPEEEEATSNRKAKKRKMEDAKDLKTQETKGEKKEKKVKLSDADTLLKKLALDQFFANATVESTKKFPHTATQFFEMVNRWFSSVVHTRSSKLEKDRNRNPLYH